MSDDLCRRPAYELRDLMAAGEVSAREVLEAHLARIDRLNPALNAIVTRVDDRAREQAQRADEALARGETPGPLHGLPIAHKDLADTAGIRTTGGSPLYADRVPEHDALIVARMKAAGCVTVGKTNVPELGAGIQTTNDVFGPTRNPYDPALTCGGSSGGAAVALATGMVPLADGSDCGGSLRNPASFCNVVGFRPSLGRVPTWPNADPFWPLATEGPMGRTVADVHLLLTVLAPADARSPLATGELGCLAGSLERDFTGVPVAYSDDLGGQLAVDRSVRDAMRPARAALARITGAVADAAPDMDGADTAYRTLRGFNRVYLYDELQRAHPEAFGPRMTWTIAYGRELTTADLLEAHRARAAVFDRVRVFLDTHQYLVTVVTQVPPWSVERLYPDDVDGVPCANYLDCMRSTYWWTLTGLPAASVPAGFTEAGLPVGVQVIGRAGDDMGVLQLARALERDLDAGARRPGPALEGAV